MGQNIRRRIREGLVDIENAREAHIRCCPYFTTGMGKPVDDGLNKTFNTCGAGHRYCDGSCWYISSFDHSLEELLK